MNRPTITSPLTWLAVLALTTSPLVAQTSAVPSLMTYQGFVTDAANQPLHPATPKNETIIFRIYNHPTSDNVANIKWAERQEATVFQGNFSVLLGNGQPNGAEPKPNLSDVMVSDKLYLGIKVGSNDEFTPRQQLLPNAFAFRAKVAETALTANTVGNSLSLNGNNVELTHNLKTGGNLDVDGRSDFDGFSSVGASSVTGTLHLSQGATGQLSNGDWDLRVEDNANTYIQLNSPDNHYAGLTFGRHRKGAHGAIYYTPQEAFEFRTNEITRLFIGSTGNVGIGTTSIAAGAKLDVNGLARFNGFTSDANASITGQLSVSTDLHVDGSTNLDGFTSDGTSAVNGFLTVSRGSSGQLSSSSAPLRVEDNENTYLQLNSPDNHHAGIVFGRHGRAQDGAIYYTPAEDLLFTNNNNTTRMTIKNNGDIEIPGKVKITGDVEIAGSLTTEGATPRHKLKIKGDFSKWREITKFNVKDWLGDEDGGRIRVLLINRHTKQMRNMTLDVYMDNNVEANGENGTKCHVIDNYGGEYETNLNTTAKQEIYTAHAWFWIHNYDHQNVDGTASAAYTDGYDFEFLVAPNIIATIYLYDQ